MRARIKEETFEQLTQIAANTNTSRSAIVRSAITALINGDQDGILSKPKVHIRTTTFSIPYEDEETLKKIAEKHGVSVDQLIRQVIEAEVAKQVV